MSGVEREPVTIAGSRQTVEGMLKGLPKKTHDIRKKHVVVKDACEIEQKIEANDRSIAGILTNRAAPMPEPREWSSDLSKISCTSPTAP